MLNQRIDALVTAGLQELRNSPYTERKYRFNGGKAGTINPCPSMPGWPVLQAPLDPGTKQGMEKFVEPIYWTAEEMRLGRVAQCYETSNMPALMDGNAANYQIIGRVRIYFNLLPKVDATQISAWELSPAATAYSNNTSLPIATLTYTTKRHFSTYFGSTISVFSHAWGSPPLNVHDVYECKLKQPQPFIGLGFDPNCKAGPDADSPVQGLVANSTDVDAQRGSQTKSTVEDLVHEALTGVVAARSEIWDPQSLDFKAPSSPNVLENREVMTKPILADALKAYTLKYLLAENLYMIAMYYQNPVATCLKVLNDYSPVNVVGLAAKRIMQQDSTIPTEFLSNMTGVTTRCLGHSVSPRLRDLRQQLIELR